MSRAVWRDRLELMNSIIGPVEVEIKELRAEANDRESRYTRDTSDWERAKELREKADFLDKIIQPYRTIADECREKINKPTWWRIVKSLFKRQK